jgi:hypothetical protein
MPNIIRTAEGAKDSIKEAIKDRLSEAANQLGRPHAQYYIISIRVEANDSNTAKDAGNL